ncbi:MAG: hypothetical protein ACYDA0_15035 [Candidatus Dormibacteraceae bacterium]
MRARHVLGALAIAGLLVCLLVALIIGSGPGGHQANAIEWTIQVLVLAGALLMLASRMRRRS